MTRQAARTIHNTFGLPLDSLLVWETPERNVTPWNEMQPYATCKHHEVFAMQTLAHVGRLCTPDLCKNAQTLRWIQVCKHGCCLYDLVFCTAFRALKFCASRIPPRQNLGPEAWLWRPHPSQKLSCGEISGSVMSIRSKMPFLAISEFPGIFGSFSCHFSSPQASCDSITPLLIMYTGG